MQGRHIQFDESRMTADIDESFRGDLEVTFPCLVSEDGVHTVVDRSYLSKFIMGYGLARRPGSFPESYREIDAQSLDYPGNSWEIHELMNGQIVGLASEALKNAVRFCSGASHFNPANFKLYAPTGSHGAAAAPFALLTDHTPEVFAINRLFENKSTFVEKFGANACPECEEKFDSPFVDCPQCSHRPESVEDNLALILEEHEGVVVLIAPLHDFGPTMKNQIRDGDVEVRKPLEFPDPEIDEIESPGAANS